MVVPGNRNHPAVRRRAGHVGVFEHVRTAVNPRTFAVPDTEHAVVFLTLRVQTDLLRAPHSCRCQLFINAWLKHHMLRRKMFFGRPQRLVIAAQRTAAIAADKTCGVQTGLRVAHALQHWQAHQRLYAAHEGAALGQCVFVVERGGFERAANVLGQGCSHRFVSSGTAC